MTVRFTKALKESLLERLQNDLDRCWAQFGEDPYYLDLERAFTEGYGIVNGFDSAIDVFRDGRLWTAQDEDFLEKREKIWADYRKKYFSAKGMRDPYVDKTEREKHKI